MNRRMLKGETHNIRRLPRGDFARASTHYVVNELGSANVFFPFQGRRHYVIA